MERLASWEQGERRPTIPQLRKLARAYKRPLAVFYLPKPPKDFLALRDFRRLPGEIAGIESPALRLEIRKARYRREVALVLLTALGDTPPRFSVRGTLEDAAEVLADKARTALGVTSQEQAQWRTPHDALNGWRTAVERLGVLVFQARGIDVSEMRGFSVAEATFPVVMINIKDHPHGRIFSMLHEFVHLMLRRDGLCDLADDSSVPPQHQQVEVFCNHVAGAALMPRNLVLREDLVRTRRVESWTDEELDRIATSYRVSREAMLRRLLILKQTTEEFYQKKRQQFLEEHRRKEDKKEGFAPPDRIAVSTAGPAFVRLVLKSFYEERITSSEVSDYLEVRLKWMPRIEEAVLGRRQDVLALA